jgi:hypothetical protein
LTVNEKNNSGPLPPSGDGIDVLHFPLMSPARPLAAEATNSSRASFHVFIVMLFGGGRIYLNQPLPKSSRSFVGRVRGGFIITRHRDTLSNL